MIVVVFKGGMAATNFGTLVAFGLEVSKFAIPPVGM